MAKPTQDDLVEVAGLAKRVMTAIEQAHTSSEGTKLRLVMNILHPTVTKAQMAEVLCKENAEYSEALDAALRANQRNEVYEECARVADAAEQEALGKLAKAEGADSQRNYAAASIAAQHIAQAIRALAKEQNDE